MNGRLVAGDDDRYVTGFSIDSRTLASGDLFFAIVAKRDGHDFAAAASKRRAAGMVVSRPVALGDDNDAFVIEVADTTRALQDLARYVRRESGAQGRGHYRQRRQDDDEGHDRGADWVALSGW